MNEPRTALLLSALVLLAACSEDQHQRQQEPTCTPLVIWHSIPAPPGETPIERWRRTEINYKAANDAKWALKEKIDDQTMLAFVELMKAEDALRELKCGELCKPADKP